MIATLRLFGLELLHLEVSTDPPDEDDDKQRDLSGGTMTADRVEVGRTDRYMGFTNGREVSE